MPMVVILKDTFWRNNMTYEERLKLVIESEEKLKELNKVINYDKVKNEVLRLALEEAIISLKETTNALDDTLRAGD
jgi:predicted nucleic acid-binding protein